MISQIISHYRIIRELGSGGMGEVYLAEDTRLGRQVAIKFLPASYQYDPERRSRFLSEARATSALRSPHIAAIFDIGEHEGAMYLVMEFVEGELLSERLKRGPMTIKDAIDCAAQIADALSEAHAMGIVHCDVKGANLMVNDRGMLKLLDFGIAAAAAASEQEPDDRTKKVGQQTAVGTLTGTVSYMSPEQAMGRTIDHRSDIFSLGVVLYEMLAARLPFEGQSPVEVIDSIIHTEPVAIARLNYGVPPDLDRILRKCLEKDRDRRYQSVRELLIDLRNLQRDSASGAQPATAALGRPTQVVTTRRSRKTIDSLAILPFANESGDTELDYLSDGVTEALINSLSRLPRLRVMARSTVFRYQGRGIEDAQQIGNELGVRAVLTGRLLERGETLLIKLEMVDTNDGAHLWGEQYTRELADILTLEQEISSEISEELRPKLTSAQKKHVSKCCTENSEAYQLYLKGRYHWNKRTEAGIAKSIDYFEQAIAIDVKFALAYAGLADAYNLMASYSAQPLATPFLRAKATALKALSLDDNLAEAHAALAAVRLWREYDWDGGERGFRKAIALNPGYATAHMWLALTLAALEKIDEALSEIKLAVDLDPLSRVANLNLARVLYFARRFDESAEQCRKTIEMYPDYLIAHRRLGIVYGEMGRFEEAEAEFKKALAIAEKDSETMSAMAYALAAGGRVDDARGVLDQLYELSKATYVAPYSLARVHIALGEIDRAFECLESTFHERLGILTYLKVEVMFDRIRRDPRFIELQRRMGLEPEVHAQPADSNDSVWKEGMP
ncbi:MAG TPA: protein kinase [Blastocatellia bacterium]|nr:protein kinase [Blastocatellia bacterium]